MAIERTLSMIKPDAVERNLVGRVLARFEEEGLSVAGIRKVHMSKRQAEGFYAEHEGRPFFDELTTYMSSGPTIVLVLEGEGAIKQNREIMGATDPADAAAGTLRAQIAIDKGRNSVHGSDSPESSAREIAYWFRSTELF